MIYANPFLDFAWGELFDTVLPDFVLAFTFFTAIIYAVLGGASSLDMPHRMCPLLPLRRRSGA